MQETQKKTQKCIDLVGEGYFKGPWKAFGFAGDFDMKHRYHETDRFNVSNGFYDPYHPTQSMVWTLDPSQYGNYLAGRSTYENYGPWGSFGVKIAGHLDAIGLALLEYSHGKFSRPPWDEKASRDMINLGLEHAGAFDYLDTRKNDPTDVDVDFKHFIECK